MKLNKVRIGEKRPGYPRDVIIDKKANLEEIDQTPSFTREELPPTTMECTIGSLPNLRAEQLLNIKAYVNCLIPPKQITRKATQQDVDVAECQLTDTTGSTKLTLWGRFATKVSNDQTYIFKNLRLKVHNGKRYLSTTQLGCSIDSTFPIENITAPKELPNSDKVGVFTIACIVKLSSYSTCINCNKKVDIPDKGKVVECRSCDATMRKNTCPKAYFCKVRLHNENDQPIHFTLFDKSIQQIVDVYNNANPDKPLQYKQLTDAEIKEVFLDVEQLNVTYDGSRVIDIK